MDQLNDVFAIVYGVAIDNEHGQYAIAWMIVMTTLLTRLAVQNIMKHILMIAILILIIPSQH